MFGAAGEVTGSCAMVEYAGARILIDCGMIQGSAADEARNLEPLPFDPRWIDAVLVTHAHVDHCGRLPLLTRNGFSGRVIATPQTAELLPMVLYGSAHVQQIRQFERARDAGGSRRGSERGGEPRVGRGVVRTGTHRRGAVAPAVQAAPMPLPIPPMYDTQDVDALLALLEPAPYRQWAKLGSKPGVAIEYQFLDAGHVIGSAQIVMRFGASENGRGGKVVAFTGDLGHSGQPLLPSPEVLPACDAVMMESTYGNRNHPKSREVLDKLSAEVRTARQGRAKLIVPTFTLGRAQQILFRLGQLSREGKLAGFPVYLDSKMAMRATELYARNPEMLESKAAAMARAGDSPLHFDELHYVTSRDESKALNRLRSGGIIIAGAGFCHGGPVVHHLINGLWRDDCRVLLVGYCPEDTPAFAMARGDPFVRLGGEDVEVNATITRMSGFSGHADRRDLLGHIGQMSAAPELVILNHGEDEARDELGEKLGAAFGSTIAKPRMTETIEI